MKQSILLSFFISAICFAQGIPIKSGNSSSLATVNSNGALFTIESSSTVSSYTCTATGLATTALYSMQLNAEASRGLKIKRICFGTSNATAAAAVTVTIQRRTTASTGGTVATAEGTASPSVSKRDPADANFGGVCSVTPTLGTAGAVLGGFSYTVGEIGVGTSDPGGPGFYCKEYGGLGMKPIIVTAGVANGVSVSVSAPGAGGLASGAIVIDFAAE